MGLKSRALSVQNFLGYEASLVSVLGIRIDKIRKEEELEHQEDDGKLDEDDGFAQRRAVLCWMKLFTRLTGVTHTASQMRMGSKT